MDVYISNATLPMNIKKISVIVCICCFLSNNFSFAGAFFSRSPRITKCQTKNFEDFKKLLNPNLKETENFFILTVARSGKKALTTVEIESVQILLELLLDMDEAWTKYKDKVQIITQNVKKKTKTSTQNQLNASGTESELDHKGLPPVINPFKTLSDIQITKTNDTTEGENIFHVEMPVCEQNCNFIQELKNSFGLVFFSEYFFSGTEPLLHETAEQCSKNPFSH